MPQRGAVPGQLPGRLHVHPAGRQRGCEQRVRESDGVLAQQLAGPAVSGSGHARGDRKVREGVGVCKLGFKGGSCSANRAMDVVLKAFKTRILYKAS